MYAKNEIETMKNYVAHCPSCGTTVDLDADLDSAADHDTHSTIDMIGTCTNEMCRRSWWYSFEIDPSGTFGVYSFTCNNGDRAMEELC